MHPTPATRTSKLTTSRFARRKLLMGSSALALGAGLFGARTGRTVAQSSVEVTMWGFPLTQDDQALFGPIQDAFRAENPDVDVRFQLEPWDGRENKMLAALAAGNPPDIVYLNPDFYPKFVDTESLVAIDEYLDEGALDDFLPGPLSAITHGGQTFGLPILTSAYTQVYNTAITQAAGIEEEPTNWETFRAAVETAHNPSSGIWGAEFKLNRPSPVTTFVPFLRMAGGDMYNEDGTAVTFAGPEGIEALDYLVSFYRDGLVQESNLTGGGLPFSTGMIGYLIQTEPNTIRAVMTDNPNLELGIAPTLEHVRKTNFGTVGSYAIFKQSSDARYEAAARWISFLTNRENTITILSASGFISPRGSIAPEEYAADPLFLEVAGQAEFMQSEPKHTRAREVFAAMQPELEAAYLGSKSVEDALAAAEEASNEIINS